MRWRRIQSNMPIIGLIVALVVGTGIAGTMFTGLSHQFVSTTGQPIENLYWQLTQAQLEYERAYRLAVEARAEPTGPRQAAALRRYEVFASRLPVITQGTGMERIRLYPDTLGYIRRMEGMIGEIDRAIGRIPDQGAKVAAIADGLEAGNRLMLGYAVAAKNTLNAEEDLHIATEHALQKQLTALFFGVALVVLAFALLAWLQLRRLGRSRFRLMHLAEELAEQKGHAEAASRAKTDFLANMSHELRTPLNAIIGFSEMIGSGAFGPLPAKYAAYVRDIHRSGQYMLELVGDLLDIAKIESGRLRLQPEWLDLRGECIEVMRDHEGAAREKGVALDAAGVPQRLYVRADRRALRRMMDCLVSNAIKFNGQAGRCTVHVGEAADALRIGVTDTGKGISPKLVARLMEPFTQDAKKTVNGSQSTGFDFSLVRRYMDMHGGRVEIASAEGSGTTVTLVFPPEAGCRATGREAAA